MVRRSRRVGSPLVHRRVCHDAAAAGGLYRFVYLENAGPVALTPPSVTKKCFIGGRLSGQRA